MKKIAIIFLILLCVANLSAYKIGLFADVQVANQPSTLTFGDQDGPNLGSFYRDTIGGIAKTTAFVTRMNVWQPDIVLFLGDIIDTANTDAGAISMLLSIGSEFANLNAPIASTIGNHEASQWDGQGGAPDMDDFFDNHYDTVIKENLLKPSSQVSSHGWCYTTDVRGVRIINVFSDQTRVFPTAKWQTAGPYSGDSTAGIETWLTDRLDECDDLKMPCVIMSHSPMWVNDNSNFQLDEASGITVFGYYDSSEYLQAVFAGHSHDGDGSIIRSHVHMINPSGAISRHTSLTVEDIDISSSPITVTTTTAHGLSTTDPIYLFRCKSGITLISDGITPLDGDYIITSTGSTTFTLDSSNHALYSGTYNASNFGRISLDTDISTVSPWVEFEMEPAVVRTSTGWRPRVKTTGKGYCNDSRFPEKKIDYDFMIFGAQ